MGGASLAEFLTAFLPLLFFLSCGTVTAVGAVVGLVVGLASVSIASPTSPPVEPSGFAARATTTAPFDVVLLSTVNSPLGFLNAEVVAGFVSGGVLTALASLLATGGGFAAPAPAAIFCSCFGEFSATVPAPAVAVGLLLPFAAVSEPGAATVALFAALSSIAMPEGAFPATCAAVGFPFPWMSMISRYGLGSRNAEYSVTSSTSNTMRVEPF